MKLPTLKFLSNTKSSVKIADGTDENGSLNIVRQIDISARFEQSNSVVYTKEGQKVTLKGKLFIFEKLDEFPDDLSGICVVNDINYDIANSSKKRNPDGSVNHITLELM